MGFIERIVGEKRAEVAGKKRRRPIESLAREAASTPVRDFAAAVGAAGVPGLEGGSGGEAGGASGRRIIAELKARTPTVESFAWSQRLPQLALIYRDSGAAAISVVTDERHFGTSLALARRARDETGLPILVKDFILDPYQVFEARAHGADAVLLIARILDWDRLTTLLDLTRELGIAALVETHGEGEVRTALEARARVIGINNRNLDTLEVTAETATRLSRLVPRGVAVVAESGIETGADVERYAAAGAHAFLVGSALLDADDPGARLAELRGVRRSGREARGGAHAASNSKRTT